MLTLVRADFPDGFLVRLSRADSRIVGPDATAWWVAVTAMAPYSKSTRSGRTPSRT